jgi:hypothetical protein
MRPATKAWMALGAGVATYEVFCPRGETLSEGVDRALEHPIGRYIAMFAIAITSAHLANLLPEQVDPYHRALIFKEGNKGL